MSEAMRELSLEEIAGLGTASPRRTKSVGLDPTDRSVTNWFKFHQYFGNCSNPNCKDDRERKVKDGNAMVSDVGGKVMCRICFVEGYNNGSN